MTCEHLYPLEKELLENDIRENFRGQAWSKNCREWVYFDCVFTNLEKTKERFEMDDDIVEIHSHFGTHDGQEHGLFCTKCKDGIMGLNPEKVKRENITAIRFE
ncbi:hypothetical protein GTQ34_03480 [Muricauda sp. JGD-17]|uniref:Uncharacterized protein n=1 Tax=Flagellimonas ochracea TaxID=2696472 RepID=A0A964WWF0_9FLAO|nr:hypothetical protein [Allomuricauda ochracea]NAY90971.1 hypothetical protein [Allomuricauda ochracea]